MTEVLRQPLSGKDLSNERDGKHKEITASDPFLDAELVETGQPQGLPRMSPVPLSELLSRKERRRRDRKERREKPGYTRRRIGVAALCLTASFGLVYEGFMFDQNTLAKMVWGSDKAEFNTLYEHSDGDITPETYVYVIPGTGIKDATPRIAMPLMPSFSSIPDVKYMSPKKARTPRLTIRMPPLIAQSTSKIHQTASFLKA